jgi:peptidoglycan DL-endopeptidase CwlO
MDGRRTILIESTVWALQDDNVKLEEEKWKKQLHSGEEELQTALDKGRRLSEDVHKYRSRCENYELQIEDLRVDLADKDKDIQSLKDDMEHMTGHVQKEIRSIKSTYDDEEKKLREENGRLSMIRVELISQKEKLEKELEELNVKFESKTTDFENRLLEARQEWLEKTKEKEDRIQELEKQYVQAKKEMRVLLKAMDVRKKESDEKLERLQHALADLFYPARDR